MSEVPAEQPTLHARYAVSRDGRYECSHCGHSLEVGSKSCLSCGRVMETQVPWERPASAVPLIAAPRERNPFATFSVVVACCIAAFVVLAIIVGVVISGGMASSSGAGEHDAIVEAAEQGTVDNVLGRSVPIGPNSLSGVKRMVSDVSINRTSDTTATVTMFMSNGAVYDREDLARDESGQWHAMGPSR